MWARSVRQHQKDHSTCVPGPCSERVWKESIQVLQARLVHGNVTTCLCSVEPTRDAEARWRPTNNTLQKAAADAQFRLDTSGMSTGPNSTKKMKRRTSSADGAPAEIGIPTAPKRQRVSRACDQCRAAREKCDGIQPLCFPCASQNRQCSWEEPKKKRGVQTGYIRTLELSLGWIFDKIAGSEEALHGLLTHEGGQGRALLLGKDTAAGNRLHRRWRKSIVHQEIDKVLSGGDTTSTKAEKTSPADESDSSGEELEQPLKEKLLLAQDALPPSGGLDETTMTTALEADVRRGGTANDRGHSVDGPTEAGLNIHHRKAHRIEPSMSRWATLPANCWRLLDVYFSYSHCWFPILEKGLVHKACWSYPAEGPYAAGDNYPGSSSHAELWAALAVAAYQEDASHSEHGHGDAEGQMKPDEIYHAARRLIPSENGTFETRHVNALLLLALVDIGRRKYTSSWILVGTATRIATALNLQSRPVDTGSRRPYHTYMACFILDTLLAVRLGQPPHLRAGDVPTTGPSGEDDQDEWDLWTPCQGFGPVRSSAPSPRSPAHSMSSFAAFFGIHRIHCAMIFDPDRATGQNELYLAQVQHTIGGNQAQRPFVKFITNGNVPPYHLPSIYLLRLAFLCCGSQTQVYSDSLPSTVLQCAEEHILNFGAAIPPLFPLYLDLLSRQYNPDHLKGETRDRWKKMQAAIDSVWPSHEAQPKSPTIHKPPDSTASYAQQLQPNILYPVASALPAAIQQLPTPSTHYADTPADQAPNMVGGDVYHDNSVSSMMGFPNGSRTRQPIPIMNHPNANPAGTGQYDLSDLSPQQFPLHGRPSFSSATFDYDAILDDIASLDRADRMGDPQFMANLGFAPGSDLTELLAHDFTGMS